jgi:arylformamidase
MSRTLIDVSAPVYSGMVHWPGDPEVKITRELDMAQGSVCNLSHLSMGAHTGTHMDAPLHFVANGESIDKLPLDATIGSCRVIELKARTAIRPEHLKPHRLRKGERVLFKTSNSRKSWKTDRFDEKFVSISKEAAQFLVDRKVMTVGVDYLSIGGYQRDGVETHQIMLGAGIWVIEGLNLAAVKPDRYELICLPLKLRGAEGAPARVVLRTLKR